MITYLASLTAWDWVCIAAGSWTVLAFVVAVPIARSMKRADDTQRASYPPPVPHPALTQADIDATWLDPWPVDLVTAPPQQVKRLFDDLIALEGLQ